MGNYGYSNLFKDRKGILVCKNTTTNVNYSYVADINIKRCVSTNYNITINLATLGLPVGQYKLYLNLPDPLNSNKLYSIQTSNLNTWTTEGFNDLLQTYTVQPLTIINKEIITDEQIKIYDIYGNFISNQKDISTLRPGIYIILINGVTTKINI